MVTKISDDLYQVYTSNLLNGNRRECILRTSELQKRNEELEHFHELFIGREKRVKELRDQVMELEKGLSKYRIKGSS